MLILMLNAYSVASGIMVGGIVNLDTLIWDWNLGLGRWAWALGVGWQLDFDLDLELGRGLVVGRRLGLGTLG